MHKKNKLLKLFLVLFLICSFYSTNAQSVIITDTVYNGDSSAILDVYSHNKGVLIPRLDSNEIASIQNPATSLLVYQKNGDQGFYFFNGSQWQKLINEQFKIYPNYEALRNDTFFSGNECLVNDFSTTFNGKTYQTFGGYFTKIQSGAENGGTILKRKDEMLWQRNWDNIHIQPEWWEVGGYDEQGLKYENDFKSQGIQHDGDRLNAVCYLDNVARIIELRPNYVYEHRQDAFFLRSGSIVNGNSATIKRLKATSELVSPAKVSQNFFTVADASPFRIGDKILAFSGNGYAEQSHITPSYNHIITNIVGNIIYINGSITKKVSSGVVQLVSDQVRVQNEVKIFNTNFDGNVQEMDATHSWVHMACILTHNKGLHIENCKFINMPSDVIICGSELWIKDCFIENIYGPFVHGSSSFGHGTFESAGFYIKNVKGRDICKVPASVNGHSSQYGFYVQSIGTNNVVIEDCNIVNGNYGGIITPLTGSSDKFNIHDNYFENFGHIMSNISTTGIEDLRITNNNFLNCGVLNFESSLNASNKYNRVNISDNIFTNCQLVILGSDKVMISNNQFYYEPNSSFVNFITSKEVFNNSRFGLLNISSSNTRISDNIISATAYDTRATMGIYLLLRSNTTFKNCVIDNNQIIGFRRGVYTLFQGTQTFRENLSISNNIIQTANYGSIISDYAIRSGHGARIMNNYIKHMNNTPAIRVYGTINQSHTISNVVINNFIEGTNYGRQIDLYYYKNIVHNNILSGGIGYGGSAYKTKNVVGINYEYNNSNYTLKPRKNIDIQQLEGNGLPTMSAVNGSSYINKLTGDMYLRISNTWKKILVQ